MGKAAVKAIKEFRYYYGKNTAAVQLNSYRKLSLPERTKRIDELMRLSRKFSDYYDALDAIANYHAGNDDTEKEIPPKLAVWALYVLTEWTEKPEADPEGMRLLSRRDMVIIHSMIVLVEFEEWSKRQAAILTGDIVGLTYGRIEQIWDDAKEYRDKPGKPEYMGFFMHHAGDGAIEIYQSWKEKGFPIVVLSA